MKRIRIEIDDDLYQWLQREAVKYNQSPADTIIGIVQGRQRQLKKWMDKWHERMDDPRRAYKERERVRLAQQRIREANSGSDAR